MSIQFIKTNPALYSYLLFKLHSFSKNLPRTQQIQLSPLIELLKEYFINHKRLDKERLINQCNIVKHIIGEDESLQLIKLIQDSCNDKPSDKILWKNLFHRYYESSFAIELLTNPPARVLNALKVVSVKIIQLLQENCAQQPELIKTFLKSITRECEDLEAVYKLDVESITLDDVIALLTENNPENLGTLFLIHFKFARHVVRNLEKVPLPPLTEVHLPLKQFICKNNPHLIFQGEKEDGLENKAIRTEFINKERKPDELFGSLKNTRGRGAFNENLKSSQLGILLHDQPIDHFPSLKTIQAWSPDVLCQSPLFESPWVKETLEQDLIYVAGPSGMTQLILSTVEFLGCFQCIESIQDYVLGIIAYITGGGLHSIDEILVVAHRVFNCFPRYQRGEYQYIFDLYKHDSQFSECLKLAWDKFNDFLQQSFHQEVLPVYLQEECQLKCEQPYKENIFIARKSVHKELKREHRSYFESKLAIVIAKQAGQFNAVRKISQVIAELLINKQKAFLDLLNQKPQIITRLYGDNIFGKITQSYTYVEDVYNTLIDLLHDNDADLVQSIHVHEVFFKEIFDALQNAQQTKTFAIVANVFEKHCFFSEPGRGRKTINSSPTATDRLGISRNKTWNYAVGKTSQLHRCGIDEFAPDTQSTFYQLLQQHDLAFVSGVSGHTARLLSGFLNYFPVSKDLKHDPDVQALKEYFAAICAYLILGGNHSFVEIAIVVSILGLDYKPGEYLSYLPQTLLESDAFCALQQQFPEYLEAENEELNKISLRSHL
jgi:hypothetical protein